MVLCYFVLCHTLTLLNSIMPCCIIYFVFICTLYHILYITYCIIFILHYICLIYIMLTYTFRCICIFMLTFDYIISSDISYQIIFVSSALLHDILSHYTPLSFANFIPLYTHSCKHMLVQTHFCMHVSLCVYYMYICICVCIYIYTYIHTAHKY